MKGRTMREYNVEILGKYSHGVYGKEFFFGMYLCGFSKADVSGIAMEILANMTLGEFKDRCPMKSHWFILHYGSCLDWDTKLGYGLVNESFSVRANIK